MSLTSEVLLLRSPSPPPPTMNHRARTYTDAKWTARDVFVEARAIKSNSCGDVFIVRMTQVDVVVVVEFLRPH